MRVRIKTIKTVRKRSFGNKVNGERDCCCSAILLPYKQTESMKREFSGILCNFYMVALTVLLPLYTRGTYVMLGDSKYVLFRNVSLLCLVLSGAAALAACPELFKECTFQFAGLSRTDICMLCYGGCVVISALCSSYGATAWIGFREWHMGALSQIIFICIYFMFSRQYQGSAWPIYLWEAAFFTVILLGLCSRVGWDPLGLMGDFNSGDWEYSHLISTIGNINWFCGYCAVALAMPVAGYLKSRSRKKAVALYVVSTLGLIVLCIQGSDVGIVLAAACLGVCLLWGYKNVTVFGRTMLLAAGTSFGLPCYCGLVTLLGDNALRALPADGPGISMLGWFGWWLLGAACIGLYFLLQWQGSKGAVVKGIWLGTVILSAAVLAVGIVLYLSRVSGSEGWVNGRGSLWRMAWQGFLRGGLKQKLLGAGPDCFAEYVYSVFSPDELIKTEGYFRDAVFANAHNQWLNHLVNIGLLGVCSAVGLFVAAIRRYRRYLPGMLALAMYGVNSLVSFQQVLSTPLFFLMLGICEYNIRKYKEREKIINVPQ